MLIAFKVAFIVITLCMVISAIMACNIIYAIVNDNPVLRPVDMIFIILIEFRLIRDSSIFGVVLSPKINVKQKKYSNCTQFIN